jgi:VIT1/CCC1 family predicted Fe2+/Mn2+ transporter
MIDKAFGLREVTFQTLQDPMTMIVGGMVMSAETDEQRNYALNQFAMTVAGLMAHAMSELLLTEEQFAELTNTIEMLTEVEQNAKEED